MVVTNYLLTGMILQVDETGAAFFSCLSRTGVFRRILTRSEDDTISLRSKVSDKHVSLENSSSATWITEKGFKLETMGPLLSAFPWWFQKLSNVFAPPQNLRKKRTFRPKKFLFVWSYGGFKFFSQALGKMFAFLDLRIFFRWVSKTT